MRYFLINEAGLIVNVVSWDGVAEWSPPEGIQAVPEIEGFAIGDLWDGEKFVKSDA